MITAEKARKLSEESPADVAEETLEEIDKYIKHASLYNYLKRVDYAICYSSAETHEIICKTLEENGFNLNNTPEDFKEYGKAVPFILEISWENLK